MPAYLKLCRLRTSEPWVICTLCCSVMIVMFIQFRCVREMVYFKRIQYSVIGSKDNINSTEKLCPYYYERCRFERGFTVETGSLWNFEIVKAVLQCYSAGYMIGQIPVGVITDWHGPRELLGLGMLISSLLCLTLPSVTKLGPSWFMVGHFVLGVSQSVVFPCTINAIANWAPASRRATCAGITISGMYLGMAMGAVLYLETIKIVGWKTGLYIPGFLGLGLCLLWLLISLEPPPHSPLMVENRRIDMPWRHVLQSRPFLSLGAAFLGYQWFHYIVLSTIRAYLQHYLHVSVYLSRRSLVVLLAIIPTAVAGGVLSDWLVENAFIPRTFSRRLFVFLGIIVPPLLLSLVPLVGCDPVAYAGLLVVMVFMKGLGEAAIYSNIIDLSPRHAGMLTGSIKTVGVIVFMSAREVFHLVVIQREDRFQWQAMYLISVSVIIIFTTPFLAYGSAREQPWTNQL